MRIVCDKVSHYLLMQTGHSKRIIPYPGSVIIRLTKVKGILLRLFCAFCFSTGNYLHSATHAETNP